MSFTKSKGLAKKHKVKRAFQSSNSELLRNDLDMNGNVSHDSINDSGIIRANHSSLLDIDDDDDDADIEMGNVLLNLKRQKKRDNMILEEDEEVQLQQQQQQQKQNTEYEPNRNDSHHDSNNGRPTKISKLQMSSEDFEEWIKLATDNKINSTNSWNFALIDYFHEMSLLKEGDNINFQKASATLDGCVKIYSSRVDSVATETGRLLTGLATKKDEDNLNNESNQNNGNENNTHGSNDDNGEANTGESRNSGNGNGKRLNRNRLVETTLVDFEAIQMKKLDQELEIDPLFKRALSEFDEGGAKSLLLNILNINTETRIVFDAHGKTNTGDEEQQLDKLDDEDSDFENVEQDDDDENISLSEQEAENKQLVNASVLKSSIPNQKIDTDVLDLRVMLATSIEELQDLDVCPSMRSLDMVLQDVNEAKNILNDLNSNKDLVNSSFSQRGIGYLGQHNENDSKDDDNDFRLPDFVSGEEETSRGQLDFGNNDFPDLGFENAGDGDEDFGDYNDGSGGQQDNLAELLNKDNDQDSENEINDNTEGSNFGVMEKIVDKDLMAYFDNNMKTNWAGPEHWKVTAFKRKREKFNGASSGTSVASTVGPNNMKEGNQQKANTRKKTPKEEFKIDFLTLNDDEDDDLEALIFQTGNTTKINIPKTQQVADHLFLLPNDIYFNSERLLKMFLKDDIVRSLKKNQRNKKANNYFDGSLANKNSELLPAASIESNQLGINEAADENYWANKYKDDQNNPDDQNNLDDNDDGNEQPDFDNGGADDDFFDAGFDFNDNLPLGANDEMTTQAMNNEPLSIGANLISNGRRIRGEFVNFSRTAKRVDVKFLKNNLWKSITVEYNMQIAKLKESDDLKNTGILAIENDKENIEVEKIEGSQEGQQEDKVKDDVSSKEENYEFIPFTKTVNNIGSMYPPEQRKDLSTSFCFICLLHLANEHGLDIENTEDGRFEDLKITYHDNIST